MDFQNHQYEYVKLIYHNQYLYQHESFQYQTLRYE